LSQGINLFAGSDRSPWGRPNIGRALGDQLPSRWLPALETWIMAVPCRSTETISQITSLAFLDLDLSEEVIVAAIIAPLKQSRQCIASPAGVGPIFREP
jgi:hypothetical protein